MSRPTYRFKKSTSKKEIDLKTTLKKIISNLTQISIICAVIGFINVWWYLGRIDQLNLLTSVISAPSTLLVIFASMSSIVLLWLFLYITPTIIFTWSVAFNKEITNINSMLGYSALLSIVLAVFGAYPENVAYGVFTFCGMFYLCYFFYFLISGNRNKVKHIALSSLIAFIVNISLLIILSIIYKQTSLASMERPVRVFILLVNLISVYVPLGFTSFSIAKNKKFSIKWIVIIAAVTTLSVGYFTLMTTGGLLYKLNDNTMKNVGLRSDQPRWFKVDTKRFPENWLEANWDTQSTSATEIWLKGYPLFQNNNILLMCPEQTMNAMNQYTLSRLTFSNNLPRGSMDSSRCILLENRPENSIRPGEMNSHHFTSTPLNHI